MVGLEHKWILQQTPPWLLESIQQPKSSVRMWMNQWWPVFEQQTAQDEVTKMYDKYQGHVASQYEQELAEHTVKYLQATHSSSATLVDTGLTRHISSKKLSGSTVFTTLPDIAVQILSHFICICITWHL